MTEQDAFISVSYTFEIVLARLYASFSRQFPADRIFWIKMVREECTHARLIKGFAEKLQGNSSRLTINRVLMQRLENMIRNIEKMINDSDRKLISRHKAFESALSIEQTAVEVHFHEMFVQLQAADSANIILKLQEADKYHVESLRKYIKENQCLL